MSGLKIVKKNYQKDYDMKIGISKSEKAKIFCVSHKKEEGICDKCSRDISLSDAAMCDNDVVFKSYSIQKVISDKGETLRCEGFLK